MADPKWKGGFDIVSSMIQHERERGLPTFNQYFAEYSEKMPFRQRKTFEDFSSNPEFVKDLKRLYKSPDDVGKKSTTINRKRLIIISRFLCWIAIR